MTYGIIKEITGEEVTRGRKLSRNELVLEGAKQIKFVLGSFKGKFPPQVDRRDIIAECVLAVLESIDKWERDHHSQCSFGSFACHRIKGAIIDHLRLYGPISRNKKEARFGSAELPIDDPVLSDSGEGASTIYYKTAIHEIYEQALHKDISLEDIIVLELHFGRGETQGEIARRMRMAHSSVTVWVGRALRRVRKVNKIHTNGHASIRLVR